jgi:hypothetical protein
MRLGGRFVARSGSVGVGIPDRRLMSEWCKDRAGFAGC